jgi:hypothetical protein
MTVPGRSARPEPGEARPGSLASPPGDRYRTGESVEPAQLERPDRVRSVVFGVPIALVIALGYGVIRSVLDLSAGLLALSALGGWLLGWAVRSGAWSGRPHRPSGWPGALAVVLAVGAWIGGLIASWLVALWLLPESTRTFAERLGDQPFLDWLGPQLGPLEPVQLLVIVAVAWVSARSDRRG